LTRVAFSIVGLNQNWQGGKNYLFNLVKAIQLMPNRIIEPVILAGRKTPFGQFKQLSGCEIIRTSWLDMQGAGIRKLCQAVTGKDFLFDRYLRKHRISVLSHFGPFSKDSVVPRIGWIADFQHKHLPELFTKDELQLRDRTFKIVGECSSCLLLSSHKAQEDLNHYFPEFAAKSKVLQFSSCLGDDIVRMNPDILEERYKFSSPYFHLPNQFWVHKNHRVVIEALNILKREGVDVLVLTTGSTDDHREPDYFGELMAYAKECDVLENFRVLDVIPYSDMIALMRSAVAVINPSLMEGWSTTVEEAKALGKRILLSDIPVHREQDPDRATFFKPTDVRALAEEMKQTWKSFDVGLETGHVEQAISQLAVHSREFAKRYQDIILDLVQPGNIY